ncbi:ankyrin repeat domain-containing protein [Leminorella grimontii]|uniref:ankyrin repeat domain-containing protein n=1 Tax=Leminorella grimontii TaxID=82981 RepID=UPI00321FF96A
MMKTHNDIFEAARAGNLQQVDAFLRSGADPTAVNDYGFTALQCAAMGTNSVEEAQITPVIQRLIGAGSQLEQPSKDGRTALYLAAEFSPFLTPVRLLVEAGSKADIYHSDSGGPHIVINAMAPEVQQYLSALTSFPIPEPKPEIPSVKMTAARWKEAQRRIEDVFISLRESGIIALHDAGYTQDDGFSDCCELYAEQGGEKAKLNGFCFYTRQDLNRAKRTSQLALAFWGAPEGADKDMEHVGRQIVETFRQAGLTVYWNGSASARPILYL